MEEAKHEEAIQREEEQEAPAQTRQPEVAEKHFVQHSVDVNHHADRDDDLDSVGIDEEFEEDQEAKENEELLKKAAQVTITSPSKSEQQQKSEKSSPVKEAPPAKEKKADPVQSAAPAQE